MQKNTRRLWWVGGIVAGVLVLAVAGGGYYFWQSQQAETESTSNSNGSPISLSVGDPPSKREEYVETPAKKLAADLNAKFVGDKKEPSISGPFGKVGDYEFFVRNENYYGVAATGFRDQADANLAMVKKELKQQGFKETVRQKGSDTDPFDALYTGNDILCEVYDLKPSKSAKKKAYESGILCADAQQFKETSALADPYVRAYQKSTKSDISNRGFYGLRVTASPEQGYKRAAINITGENQDAATGYLLVFYQAPDGVWRYFTSTQGLVSCSKYDTAELQAAFKGEPCTSNGEATAVGAGN